MTVLQEGDMEFDFRAAHSALKFDNLPRVRQMTPAGFKAVDFVIDDNNQDLWVEVKDPENRGIPAHLAPGQRRSFINRMHHNKLIKELQKKFSDTLYFIALEQGIRPVPLHYAVVLGIDTLDPALLLAFQHRLRERCHQPGPGATGWAKGFEVVVLTIAGWNHHFGRYPARRP